MAARKGKRVTVKAQARPAAKKVGKAKVKAKASKKGVAKKGVSKSVAKKSAPKPARKKAGAKIVKAGAAKKSAVKPSANAANPSAKKSAKPTKSVALPKVAKKELALTFTDASTPARAARQLLEQRKAIKSALAPTVDGKDVVDAYMRDVDHPFKAEMEAVRQIILGVSPKLSERIKWNAPSFYYREDLGAFNPRATEFAHLILLFPGGGALPEKSPILEGSHKDRREVKFHSMDDVKAKQRPLEKIIKEWVALRDS
jgi:hypothetical protein